MMADDVSETKHDNTNDDTQRKRTHEETKTKRTRMPMPDAAYDEWLHQRMNGATSATVTNASQWCTQVIAPATNKPQQNVLAYCNTTEETKMQHADATTNEWLQEESDEVMLDNFATNNNEK